MVQPFFLVMAIIVGGCAKFTAQKQSPKETSEETALPAKTNAEITPSPVALASKFTAYQDVPVNATPAIKAYQAAPDLSNITNKQKFSFTGDCHKMLVKNGFVVVPNNYKEFFILYENNRYDQTPNFITTDSLLHNYHLFFNHLLKTLENEVLALELKKLNKAMLRQAQNQYLALKKTAWENAAKRNMGFFAVADKLLDPEATIPAPVKSEVAGELALIEKHEGIAVSPLMNMGGSYDPEKALKEDYSQYIPRGHYERTDLLKRYFKSMMWYGRMTFRVKNEDEVRSAGLITLALNKKVIHSSWDKIYEPTNFLVGKSDDLNYYQFNEILTKIYGPKLSLSKVISQQDKWASFLAAVKKLTPPAINSIPVFNRVGKDKEEVKGFRFMGQRFTLDAAIFQRLIHPEVNGRMLPKGMDIPAALGAKEVYLILNGIGETKYPRYAENMSKIKAYTASLKKEIWTQNLYWGWLYTLLPLKGEKPKGYPSFMQNTAWARKEINTFLGNWTELKHDTILYAKQVYAEGGNGLTETDDRGYVEPNPYVYARFKN